ncbi:Pentatricopeptide repeat-containing protein [Camellia lanceoleosa]|uniref:Pentatricopeptide repeat-containing protein n=1 Tax=Camellia lanceoleosa TaxID=1840588 RepID=A0ACC0HMM6_9ERIC|nr:Pentatricopeptide repeat-containing protein [Camellia lanceoleosa]
MNDMDQAHFMTASISWCAAAASSGHQVSIRPPKTLPLPLPLPLPYEINHQLINSLSPSPEIVLPSIPLLINQDNDHNMIRLRLLGSLLCPRNLKPTTRYLFNSAQKSISFDSTFPIIIFRQSNFVRSYCCSRNDTTVDSSTGSGGWTDDIIEYLDESGGVIFSGKGGIRSVEHGLDDHVMVGAFKKPFLNASAVAKIVEIVKRWKWGPEMDTQLDRLQFVPNKTHISQALKLISDTNASLSLFRWATRQSWYSCHDKLLCYTL